MPSGQYLLDTFPDCLTLDTTYACNLKCKMCHQSSPDFKLPDNPHISIALIERMIPLMRKVKSVFFLGAGEPLMHPQIFEIISLVKSKAPTTSVAFTTNGTLINEEIAHRLIDSKLDSINVSIDGFDCERGHQGSRRTIENLKRLNTIKADRGVSHPKINLGFVAGLDNMEELIPLLTAAHEINCRSIVVEPLRIVSANNEWNEYIRKNDIYQRLDYVKPIFEKAAAFAKAHNIEIATPYIDKAQISFVRLKCDWPFKFLKVTMDGNVYMCPQGYPARANAFSADLVELWNSECYTSLRRKLDTENFDRTCWNCPLIQPVVEDESALRDGLKQSSAEALADYLIVHRKYIRNCENETDVLRAQVAQQLAPPRSLEPQAEAANAGTLNTELGRARAELAQFAAKARADTAALAEQPKPRRGRRLPPRHGFWPVPVSGSGGLSRVPRVGWAGRLDPSGVLGVMAGGTVYDSGTTSSASREDSRCSSPRSQGNARRVLCGAGGLGQHRYVVCHTLTAA